MLKNRYIFIALGFLLYSTASSAEVGMGNRMPSVSIGINLPTYPDLVTIPGYPVYYAPQLNANFFFYDGMYWVYQDDYWYSSIWYNGPWDRVDPNYVPVFILRIPVYYYRQPPAYFYGWQPDAPPHWGDHWGHEWEQRRKGWGRWVRGTAPAPAPLPAYQRQYTNEYYPQRIEQQQELLQKNYRYWPHDPAVRQRYQQLVPKPQGRDENPQE